MSWPYHNFRIQTPENSLIYDLPGLPQASYPAAVAFCCNIDRLEVACSYSVYGVYTAPDTGNERVLADDNWSAETEFDFSQPAKSNQTYAGWYPDENSPSGPYYPIMRKDGITLGFWDLLDDGNYDHHVRLQLFPYMLGGAAQLSWLLNIRGTNAAYSAFRYFPISSTTEPAASYVYEQVGIISGMGISAPIYWAKPTDDHTSWTVSCNMHLTAVSGAVPFEPEPQKPNQPKNL